MDINKNPFQVRTSEQVSSDTRFVGLFGPGVLQTLPEDGLWDRLVIFRSTPGAGKTSILRLFTPGALRAVHQYREREFLAQLTQQMEEWGVLSNEGPQLLGVLLSCEQQYAALREIASDDVGRQRSFYALLNARIILAALRGALMLAGGKYPADVSEVRFEADPAHPGVRAAMEALDGMDGGALYARACEIERSICAALDDIGLDPEQAPEGHADLWALYLLSGKVRVGKRVVATRCLIMFDDLHLLHSTQRAALRNQLAGHTLPVARWVAERWQGLEPEEIVSPGARHEREYEIVRLDGWADEGAARLGRFERLVTDIADRRTRESTVMQREALHEDAFHTFLQEFGDAPLKPEELERTLASARERVLKLTGRYPRYHDWVSQLADRQATTLEHGIQWRNLEIMVERDLSRSQGELFNDDALPADELDSRGSSSIQAAAELFFAREHKLPYYYGSRRLAQLASWNIEQFLDLAADVFDLALTAVIMEKGEPTLTPKMQDEVVRNASRQMMGEIRRRVPSGTDVLALVRAVGQMSHRETYRPTAPYSPGVNGFAISMADLDRLRSATFRRQLPGSERLLRALGSALANNVFAADFDIKCKGRKWAVFYLNRLLCPYFELPLGYGSYRERKLAEVIQWIRDPEIGLTLDELQLSAAQ